MEELNKLNRAEKDRYIVYVGMYGNSNAAIWGQYDRMVDYIFDNYPQSGNRFDPIAIPLLHTIAHGIELGIKENIAFFHTYHESEHLKNYESWPALEKSHDLGLLADEFRIGYFKLFDQFRLGQEERNEFNKYFTSLQELLNILERSSETFRYATKLDKHGVVVKLSVEPGKTFDLLHIKSLFDMSKTLFIGAPNSLGHYTDFIDYQRDHEDYDAGLGYLYCQRLHYTEHFLEQTKEWMDGQMKQIRPGLWFDSKTTTNYEIQVWENNIYIIAVNPGKIMRRQLKKGKKKEKK